MRSSRAAIRTPAGRRPSTRCSSDRDAGRGRDRDSGAVALRPREAGARGRQARVRREAARDDERRDRRARRARGRARPRPHARPSAALPPWRRSSSRSWSTTGELGEVLCVYGNRQNLGRIRPYENALWSLGVHDLSVILYLLDEDPTEAIALGPRLPAAWRRGRRLLLPPLPVRPHRAHAPLVARSAQDAEDDRRRLREDGGRSTTWSSTARSRCTRRRRGSPSNTYGEWQTRTGRHPHSEDRDRRAARGSSAGTSCRSSRATAIARTVARRTARGRARAGHAHDVAQWRLRSTRARPSIRERCSATV